MFYYFSQLISFNYSLILISILFHTSLNTAEQPQIISDEEQLIQSDVPVDHRHVEKVVLDNGLTILICESHEIPKVSCQMWYNVGSKDELIGEKGIAHLLEHMVFKGTDILSESDIRTLARKLSGGFHASTYNDCTMYFFDLPTQYWKEAFPILANCMTNSLFKDEHLNSELKAVIQEFKLYKDNYKRSLLDQLKSTIFADHPYHYPIIGYKQDLWNVRGKDLLAFYKKHYYPNNATLVVVGDVNAAEVIALAQQHFGAILPDENYTKRETFLNRDIASTSLTLYRDVQQPLVVYAFVVPGAREKKSVALSVFKWLMGNGKNSRLYKKLVNEKQLATNVSIESWGLVDHGLFFIEIEPKKIESESDIQDIIVQELADIIENGITDEEFERGFKKTQMEFYNLFEDIEYLGKEIGYTYLATGDENYVFTCLDNPALSRQQVQEIVTAYFRPSIMHKGFLLPLAESEKKEWALLQEESDTQDEKILASRVRDTPVEPASYAETIEIQKPVPFNFPKPQTCVLSNRLKVLYYDNNATPKINIILQFKARSAYDSEDQQGLYKFVTRMMMEGTENYTGEELARIIESRGMSLNVYPGGISVQMLTEDFVFGLQLVREILTKATFPEEEIEKVRDQLLTYIKEYWDNPWWFTHQLICEEIYKNHPYSKRIMGTEESITSISRDDLINFYDTYISPDGARIAIVGELPNENIEQIIQQELSGWDFRKVEAIEYPLLKPTEAKEIAYTINRDQVVLSFAQLSIARIDPKFDAYLLFDQIFGGGRLGQAGSRLFHIREQTGLFYTIWGSLLQNIDEQPGIFEISTKVSLDRLEEAKQAIKNTIDTVADTLTQEELEMAKRAVINTLVDNFATNSDIAKTFLYLDRFKLPADYFDNRATVLEKITLEDMKTAVKDILNSEKMITVEVGRV